jgi:hypothetical protein
MGACFATCATSGTHPQQGCIKRDNLQISRPSIMSLSAFAPTWPLRQTSENLTAFDAGLIVLLTSFVRYRLTLSSSKSLTHNTTNQGSHLYFRYLEPRSAQSLTTLLFLVPALLSVPIFHCIRRPFAAVLLAFTAYPVLLIFFTLAYRLSPFHPLASYPGPVIAKLSKWWGAYVSVRGDPHRYLKNLHDRYGDIVRVGQRALLTMMTYQYLVTQPRLQVPMSSPSAKLLLYNRSSAKAACPEDLVRI